MINLNQKQVPKIIGFLRKNFVTKFYFTIFPFTFFKREY